MLDVAESVITLLGGEMLEETQLKVINSVIDLTSSRLSFLLDTEEIPENMRYIIIEVSVARFNRIGSEGVSSHQIGEENMTFSDNDFGAYLEDIETWKKRNKSAGRIRFL